MNMSLRFGKRYRFLSTLALALVAGATVSAQAQAGKLRIGVYDSRAVAVAYADSSEHQEVFKAVHAEFEKATAAKDEKQLKEIKDRMKLQQLRMHEQGFSTGSVASIMEKVKTALPDVAKKAGVDLIVSKWELNYQSSAVEVVDVTDEVTALFHVSAKGKEWLKSIRDHPPVPMEQINFDTD